MADLPPGFELDAAPKPAKAPAPPPGFKLDPPKKAAPADDVWLPTRIMGAFNEGMIADTLGAPVDVVNAMLSLIPGLGSDEPILGSKNIRRGMHAIGVGQTSEAFAPRSRGEAYAQSIARSTGQVVLPVGGTMAAGSRMLATGAPLLMRSAGPVRNAFRTMAVQAAAKPATALIAEGGSALGAGTGGQFARETFPDSPLADVTGQLLGGLGGGIAAGTAAARRAAPPEAASLGAEQSIPRAAEAPTSRKAVAAVEAGAPAPALPEGFVLDDLKPASPKVPPARQTPDQLAAVAEKVDPGQVLPVPRESGSGIPAGDDAAPMEALATPREELPSVAGKIGNIRVDKLSNAEDISRALQTVNDHFGGFDAATRGKIGQAETKALADELNLTPEDLLRRRRGQALNAEQAFAARAILAKSGDELVSLARRAQGGAEEDLASFRAGLLRHAAIQEQVSGATAEAGRALSQFRMDVPNKFIRRDVLKAIVDSAGGRDKLEDVAKRLLDLSDDPAAQNAFARQVVKPGFWDMAKEYWINSLLSGPRTHATNIGSNLLTSLWSLPEHAATAAIGKVTRSPDRMLFRDVGARAIGMMEGARDGLKLARKALMTGEPTDGVSQVEAQQYRAIPGKLGSVIRTPTRALTAEDEFFKSIAYRGELNALAARKGLTQGKSAAESRRIFEELRDNPTDEMVDQAAKAARYQTFQAPLTGPGVQIQMLANKGPMKLFLPFVRTPLNLLKYATERTPLAPVLSEFRDAVKKGGMARDQALARVSMGSGLAALAVSWALEGKLTGSGPVDAREQQALRDTGWQPFSVKVGDTWYSYQRIDPFSRILSTAADFATLSDYMTDEERQNIASTLSLALARNVSTMPTLDPAASAFEALSDPDRYLSRYAKNLAASAAVPNVVTQINSTLDPYMRETDSLMDTIRSRIPGLSEKLPARMNLWGQPVERGNALGPDIVSPIWEGTDRKDKTLAEVSRLDLKLSKPDRTFGKTRLSPDQYAQFVRMAGAPAKEMLDEMVTSPDWSAMPDGTRRVVIREIVTRFRKVAKARMLAEYPELMEAEQRERIERKTGEPVVGPLSLQLPPGNALAPKNAMAPNSPRLNALAR